MNTDRSVRNWTRRSKRRSERAVATAKSSLLRRVNTRCGVLLVDCCPRSPLIRRCHIACKELAVGQTFQRLLGYVHKDEGKPHFQNTTFGDISRADIDAGKQEWQSLKIDYMDGKIALTKMNIFARLHAFVEMDAEDRGSFCETVAKAVNSGKYMISANMFCTMGGQMRAESADAYWRIINGETCTAAMVQNILCAKEYKPRYYQNMQDHANDGLYRIRRSNDQEMGDFVPLPDPDECMEAASDKHSGGGVSVSSSSNNGIRKSAYQKIKRKLQKMRQKLALEKRKKQKRNKFILREAEGESDNDEEEEEDEESSYESSFIDDDEECFEE